MTQKWYEQPVKAFEISASRWPWQSGYNWRGSLSSAPLNKADAKTGASARFGGGWKYKLGISTAGWKNGGIELLVDLLFGSVRIVVRSAVGIRKEKAFREGWKARIDRAQKVEL